MCAQQTRETRRSALLRDRRRWENSNYVKKNQQTEEWILLVTSLGHALQIGIGPSARTNKETTGIMPRCHGHIQSDFNETNGSPLWSTTSLRRREVSAANARRWLLKDSSTLVRTREGLLERTALTNASIVSMSAPP